MGTVDVKEMIEQEKIALAKETALELGYTNSKIYSKPITFIPKGNKPKIKKPLRKPRKSLSSKIAKIKNKKLRRVV